ncbi:hypothetical protein [Sulfolobus sp. E11-6]|uniref:hypothetical protein n=1 Tax=Sulfolobus sp. E11-6 TaxID=2663020 RepID=UPI001294D54E|nr:hypothetical protein [Sulfolobus sp. E11-6]QGA69298.1 hypothetical protein GFS33_11885 [Sulfolobus sp. E11-6]
MQRNVVLYVSEILEICKKVKLLAYFGSYTRQEDFVEGISDINIFAITEDKYLILELASLGYSPIVLSEKTLIDICEKGDPICYYLLYDSNVICGQFPKNLKFNLNNFTCERIRKSIFSFMSSAVTSFFRKDEISTISNSFKALRSIIQWKSCINLKNIPLKNDELKNRCRELNLSVCNEFSDIVLIRRMKAPLSLWSLDKIVEVTCSEFKINCAKPSKVLELVKNPVQVTYNENGTVIIKDNLGRETKIP